MFFSIPPYYYYENFTLTLLLRFSQGFDFRDLVKRFTQQPGKIYAPTLKMHAHLIKMHAHIHQIIKLKKKRFGRKTDIQWKTLSKIKQEVETKDIRF